MINAERRRRPRRCAQRPRQPRRSRCYRLGSSRRFLHRHRCRCFRLRCRTRRPLPPDLLHPLLLRFLLLLPLLLLPLTLHRPLRPHIRHTPRMRARVRRFERLHLPLRDLRRDIPCAYQEPIANRTELDSKTRVDEMLMFLCADGNEAG